jgi:hypothetical protein
MSVKVWARRVWTLELSLVSGVLANDGLSQLTSRFKRVVMCISGIILFVAMHRFDTRNDAARNWKRE